VSDSDQYFSRLLMNMSDLESTKRKNAEAEAKLRELEAKVAELEEKERHWQEERTIFLRRIKGKKK
jgi:cell shape-determining protein MreC